MDELKKELEEMLTPTEIARVGRLAQNLSNENISAIRDVIGKRYENVGLGEIIQIVETILKERNHELTKKALM